MYSTLLTLAIKACPVVNSSLFGSKYFHFTMLKWLPKLNSRIFHSITRFSPVPPYVNPPYHLVTTFNLCSSSKCLELHSLRLHFSHPPTQQEALSSLITMAGCALSCKIFTFCYSHLFYFSLVILSHSSSHYIILHVTTINFN